VRVIKEIIIKTKKIKTGSLEGKNLKIKG